MRITIDTGHQVIIVPNSYYTQIDKLNEVIEAAGGAKLDYTQHVKDSFANAVSMKVIYQSDIGTLAPRKAKKKPNAKSEDEKKPEDKGDHR